MPARRLDDTAGPIRLHDVVGIDSPTESEFVEHVGLCNSPRSDLCRASSEVRLTHMGPPLSSTETMPVNTFGSADLDVDDIRQIELFIDELALEYQAEKARGQRQYTIHPHVLEPDPKFPFKRFSCVGFAIEAYRDAGIDLLTLDEQQLPPISLKELKQAYPDVAHLLDSERIRNRYGLSGVGPWPVVLAGYTINAMNRSAGDIRSTPYTPSQGDEYFPPKP